MSQERPFEHERFEVIERLGSGGFGTVYKVHDREADQIVALKHLQGQSPNALLQFKNEFRGLADVHHPNLVTLFELHQQRSEWFFTMEYVEGVAFDLHIEVTSRSHHTTAIKDLHGHPTRAAVYSGDTSVLLTAEQTPGPVNIITQDNEIIELDEPEQRSPLTVDPGHIREIFAQLASGLSWLHHRDTLHCDIKPSNVLVERRTGRVVLLDFGLSRRFTVLPSQAEVQRSGQLMGTPPFMAPEICAEREAVPASDWYSFGVMLFHALTGVLPFDGSPVQVIMDKQTRRAPSPSHLVEGIPRDLDELCVALLERHPLRRPDPQEIHRVLGSTSEPSVSGMHAAVSTSSSNTRIFVGRESELDTLRELYREDVGGVVLVQGPSGYGKSALIEAFSQLLPRGTWLLRSRCYERSTVAYKAFDSAIDDLRLHLGALEPRQREALYPPGMWALARVFHIFTDIVESPGPEGSSSWDMHRVRRIAYVALRELLQRACEERRVLLLIDDLQWIDEDSISLLSELVRPQDAPELPVLFVTSFRDELTSNTSLQRAVEELRRTSHLRELFIGPLQPQASAELASLLMQGANVDASTLDAVVRGSEGNPLFLEGLATDRVEGEEPFSTHTSLARVILRRIDHLDAPARHFMTLVALAGQPVEQHLITTACRDKVSVGLEQITRLRQLRLLRSASHEHISPYHDRVREAITNHLAHDTRQHAHLALAEAAITLPDPEPGFVSAHFIAAGLPERAKPYTLAAARAADEALAFDSAARFYRELIELGDPDGSLHRLLGDALRNAGHGPDAAAAYLQAVERMDDPRQSQPLKIAAVEQLLFAGAFDEGESVIREVLGGLGLSVANHELAAFSAFALQGARLKLRGFHYTLREPGQIPRTILRQLNILWSATIGLSMVQPIASQAIEKRYLILALEAGDPSHLVRALGIELAFSGLQGGRDERGSQAIAKRADALLEQVGDDPYLHAFIAMAKSAIHWLRGRWRAIEDTARLGIPVFEKMPGGVTWEIDTSWLMVLNALLHQGRLSELRALLPDLLAGAVERGDLYFETQLRTRFSPFIALCDDRPQDCVLDLTRSIHRWTTRGYHIVHYWAYLSHTQALLYSGKASQALAHLKAGEWVLKRSLLLMGQYYRVLFQYLKMRALLACALEEGITSRSGARHLNGARKYATKLIRGDLPWIPPHGHLGRGLVAWAEGQKRSAESELEHAARGFAAVDMPLHARVSQRRLAELRGEEDVVVNIDREIALERISNPARLCDMLAPSPLTFR